VSRFLHLTVDSFFFLLEIAPLLHLALAYHLHLALLHATVLHGGHVLHVMLHFLGALGFALRRAQSLFDRERRFIAREQIRWSFCVLMSLRIGRIMLRLRRCLCYSTRK